MPQHYPLAFDGDGNPILVPDEGRKWRVRRGGGRRGRPRHVFDPETGRQLEIPLTATFEDLIDLDFEADRYRLEVVDEAGHILPNLPAAVVEIQETVEDSEARQKVIESDSVGRMAQLVGQLVDANCRAMSAMASAFGPVLPVQPPPPPKIIVEREPAAEPPKKDGSPMMEQVVAMLTNFAQTVLAQKMAPSAPGAAAAPVSEPPPPPKEGGVA